MNIDDLKNLWQHHSRQLEDHLTLNEQILRQMKLSRTNGEFRKLMKLEIFSVVSGFLCTAALVYFTVPHLWIPQYAILGIVSVGIMLTYLIFSMLRLTGFSKLCSYDESVVKVQKELACQKKRLLRFRNIELITMPICIVAILPVLSKSVYDYEVLQNPGKYITGVAISCIVAIPFVVWVYRTFYDKRIASAEALLQSITEFEESK